MNVERLREVKSVYYHQSCPDGTASAMICYEAFRLLHKSKNLVPEFKSVQYNTDFFEKLEPKPGQLFIDITPPKARWEEWKPVSPLVLDHHESVENVTLGLGGIYATNDSHSGARLAFEQILLPITEHLCEDLDPERDSHNIIRSDCNHAIRRWDEFSRLAMIRDTWKDEHPDFVAASIQAYGLMTLGSGDLLDQLREERFDPRLITRMGEKDYGMAKFVADSARRYEIPCPRLGRPANVDIYNCTEKKLISDGCHHLLSEKGTDLAVSYFLKHQDGKTTMIVSLRSKEPFSGIIAKNLGGGGHAKAAGFGLEGAEGMSMITLSEVLTAQLAALQ